MDKFQILEWDSKFFGIPVASILPDTLSMDELGQVVSRLKKQQVKLVYWASTPNDEESQKAARMFHGFLADKKITFVVDVSTIPRQSDYSEWVVEEYTRAFPCADLERLAIEASICSRFAHDSHIPEKKVVDLYRLWIRNSVRRQIADAVLVVRQSCAIVGMVTVAEKKNRGSIGLLAVDEGVRGKGIGVALTHAAQMWTRDRGLRSAQVVTQTENAPACKLYEKCGYKVEKVEYVYHFWI